MNRLLLVAMTILISGPALAQPDATRKQLDTLITGLETLRTPEAAPRLLVLRRELPEFARPILVLRRQARAAKAEAELGEKVIESVVAAVTACARRLSKDPNAAIAALDDLRAEKGSEGARLELLDALDRSFHLKVADAAITRFAGRGAWAGMFRDLLGRKRPRVARAFMDHFLDRLNDAGYRSYAAQGAAELAPEKEREAWARKALLVWKQVDENAEVRRSGLVLAKRLGADAEFDAEVARHEKIIGDQLALVPGKRSLSQLLLSYEELVDLLGRAGLIERALVHEAAYCRLLLGNCSYASQPPEARRGIAAALYDFACRLSLGKRDEAAMHVLQHALSWGYRDHAWVETDPELTSLRSRGDFSEKIAAWKEGKRKRGTLIFEPKRWDRIVGKSVAQKATKKKRE